MRAAAAAASAAARPVCFHIHNIRSYNWRIPWKRQQHTVLHAAQYEVCNAQCVCIVWIIWHYYYYYHGIGCCCRFFLTFFLSYFCLVNDLLNIIVVAIFQLLSTASSQFWLYSTALCCTVLILHSEKKSVDRRIKWGEIKWNIKS